MNGLFWGEVKPETP